MIVIVLSIVGAILGWRLASRRDGNKLDKLQFAAVYFMAFAVVGLFLTVIIDRII